MTHLIRSLVHSTQHVNFELSGSHLYFLMESPTPQLKNTVSRAPKPESLRTPPPNCGQDMAPLHGHGATAVATAWPLGNPQKRQTVVLLCVVLFVQLIFVSSLLKI